MSPFEIDVMLHVYSIAEPMDLTNELRRLTVDKFIEWELIRSASSRGSGYELTPRGSAYVHFLCTLPLPVANWTIPGPWNPSLPPAPHSMERKEQG